MRIHQIDSIRGFALVFLFVVNIPIWNYATIQSDSDFLLGFLRTMLLDGRLYMIFSCMFGASILLANKPSKKFYKRMAVLFLIGMIHGIFLNYLDILAVYAILGIWAYSFRNCSERGLVLRAIGFLAVPIVVYGLIWFFTGSPDFIQSSEKNPLLYEERFSLWLPMLINQLLFHSWEIMGMMLFGMAMVKINFFSSGFSKSNTVVIAFSALILMFLYALQKFNGGGALMQILYHCAAPLFAVCIISIVAKLNLKYLAPVGKVSLSIYLIQSVIGTLLVLLGSQVSLTMEIVLSIAMIPIWISLAYLIQPVRPFERLYRFASR